VRLIVRASSTGVLSMVLNVIAAMSSRPVASLSLTPIAVSCVRVMLWSTVEPEIGCRLMF